MSSVWEQSWFWPVLAVVVAFPILLLVLTELQSGLARRNRPSAKLVALLKNFVLPSAAILILVAQVTDSIDSPDFTWTRIVATVLGFLLILFVLNTVNLTLFTNARVGTWRDRLPSIFVDLGRIVLICVGLAVLFSVVWGTDVGGLFTALGVGSIVIGLALQGAIGSVVSGLLLLFEQPFRLGDWIEADGTRGRIIEVNWRAVHIDTGNGILIMPNASLAGAAFTNISQAIDYTVTTKVTFSTDDSPIEVCSLLQRVADRLPELAPGTTSAAAPLGGADYELSFNVTSPAVEGQALGKLRTWLWYAARRGGLALDGDTTDAHASPDHLAAALRQVAPVLRLDAADSDRIAPLVHLERFAAGEVLLEAGAVPHSMQFILRGRVSLGVPIGGDLLPVSRAEAGDYVGHSALTREVTTTSASATTETSVLVVPVAVMDDLLRRRPQLAREFGRVSDKRQEVAQAVQNATQALSTPITAN